METMYPRACLEHPANQSNGAYNFSNDFPSLKTKP